MTWLSYSDDEVGSFHPVFEACGNDALVAEGLDGQYQWVHHLRGPGSRLVPDFVLIESASHRWRLTVEVKRRPESVHSDRSQAQAKSYAESPVATYPAGWAKYFAVTNLEQTLLFALNGIASPRECRVAVTGLEAGSLTTQDETAFRTELTRALRSLVAYVHSNRTPAFDVAWPKVGRDFVQAAAGLSGVGRLGAPSSSGWPAVERVFGLPASQGGARVLVLRCLLAEYLRGLLERHGHARAGTLQPVPTNAGSLRGQLPRVWDRLRDIDFRQLFDAESLPDGAALARGATELADYLTGITTAPTAIYELARDRLDREELYPVLVGASSGGRSLDESGKVPTDPELATLLASLVIRETAGSVSDPCCGDGALLSAAYDRLSEFGLAHDATLGLLQGIEADPLLARLAILRLLTKEPATITASTSVDVRRGDLFADPGVVGVDYVLMNPPFRRYEEQGGGEFPPELRQHYADAISRLTGRDSLAVSGQQNLYTYYVEWIIGAAPAGTRFGIVLDNKWYHNRYARPLRELLLRECAIEAIVEYPYANLFEGWAIATSVLVCTKRSSATTPASTKFARCSMELSQVDPAAARRGIFDAGPVPAGWSVRTVRQADLRADQGWKKHFDPSLRFDYAAGLPPLPSLFEFGRRGSLAKEEGGMSALAFPFSRRSFGHLRRARPGSTRRYQNQKVRALTNAENQRLTALARAVPDSFRGYALENPDVVSGYVLTTGDVRHQQTIEPPSLRGDSMFEGRRRSPWSATHATALSELEGQPATAAFLREFRRVTGLTSTLMPPEDLLIGLREPAAGQLIIPRKMRSGHKVLVNPFPEVPGGRQVRLSSNFLSYSNPTSVDAGGDLDSLTAVRLIAAFLLSSYGQLQFEMYGANREGLLAVEDHHLAQVRVLDPRTVSRTHRREIIAAFDGLPFPISSDRLSSGQPERNTLDSAIAAALSDIYPALRVQDSLDEVHDLLDEYLLARQP